MENRRDLSLRLNDVLNMVGASEKMRILHSRTATEIKDLDIYDFIYESNCLVCGSRYEGTVTPDLASDCDLIVYFVDQTIVHHRLMAATALAFLIVRDSWTYPGLVKLHVLIGGRPYTFDHFMATIKLSVEVVDQDVVGRACLKNCFFFGNKHGPAVMEIDDNGNHTLDLVFAFKCNGIPLWATEWITRVRRFNWPSQQQLNEMRIMGCMFVGVGHYNSPERDVEWRLSFTLQERMLMRSLNPTQHKVFILLKMIKNNILEKCMKQESLSSYHLKTCVFYMVENTPSDMWTAENLINCLIECLKLLLEWISDKHCPSYFIKEQNLFDKEGFHLLLEHLECLMYLLLQTGHQFLHLLHSDRVGEMMKGEGLGLYKYVSKVKLNTYVFNIKFYVICSIGFCHRNVLLASKFTRDVLSFLISQQDRIKYEDITRDQKVHLHLHPWLHLYIGMEYAARAVTCVNKPVCKKLMKLADHNLHMARKTDLVSSRLVQASVLFRSQKFEECFMLLQEIRNSWTDQVINDCFCNSQRVACGPTAERLYERFPSMQNISVTKLMTNHYSFCVIFLRSQAELAPPPLQYEMWRSLGTQPGSRSEKIDAWFDRAVVDAKVYMYFLQYLVCAKLDRKSRKQMAMDNLVSLLQWPDIQYNYFNHLYHKETAYNLLGWIFLQEHRIADAVQCFIKSWQIRPFHNAAKFHVLNIYARLVGRHTISSEMS